MLPDPSQLPFRLGNGPFKIKGVAYRGTKKQYDSLVKGGAAAVAASFTYAELSIFSDTDFFASSWYDIFPMAYMDYRAAEIAGLPFEEFAHLAADLQAKSDMNGVYRLLLKFFSPASALKQLAVLSTIYFNFGKSSVSLESKAAATVTTVGVPVALEQWFLRATAYYIGYCLQLTGAKNLRYEFLKSKPGEAFDGQDTVDVRWRVTWDA